MRYCTVDGCAREYHAQGVCLPHYKQLRRRGLIKKIPATRYYKLPEYDIWIQMKMRCLNPKNKGYENYGARGITVCARWLESFEAFYDDMGPRPSPELSIERINNDGDYEPENCKWGTRQEQNLNKRHRIVSKTGERHIYHVKGSNKKLCVRIIRNYKETRLGGFDSMESATKARDEFLRRYTQERRLGGTQRSAA